MTDLSFREVSHAERLPAVVADSVQVTSAAPQPGDYEKALTLIAMNMYRPAIAELRTVTRCEPAHHGAWRKLAALLRWAGEDQEADHAGAAAERCAAEASNWQPSRDTRTPEQLESAEKAFEEQFAGKDLAAQTDVLRTCLVKNPRDAAAIHLLSRLAIQSGDIATSLALLERTLELAPFYDTARAELATTLMGDGDFVRALEHTTILLEQKPLEADYYAIHCDALSGIGDFGAALAITEELLRQCPHQARFWYDYGHLLQAVRGRDGDAVLAFRKCLEIAPTMGEAYWRISGFLTQADVAALRSQLADPGLSSQSRMYMFYALGRALEQAGDYAPSFKAYQHGARLFRGNLLGRGQAHREDLFIRRVRDLKRAYAAPAFERCAALPTAAVTPIFIVGLPRAGSTLVEQILASHSKVEAAGELAVMAHIVRDLEFSRRAVRRDAYPDCMLEMAPADLAALGERYLLEAAPYRKTDRPYFIDKCPWNWQEAGLIRLILPHAKIIDVRRDPMAACFAMYKQVLDGCDFSYDLHDLGRYYTEYAGLMDHWESVMPGVVHFVQYERLVEDTESAIRHMLDYCGLQFEEACLRFWESERAVQTASAEQVRRPIYRDAVAQWRNFEPWLGPLKAALSEPARA